MKQSGLSLLSNLKSQGNRIFLYRLGLTFFHFIARDDDVYQTFMSTSIKSSRMTPCACFFSHLGGLKRPYFQIRLDENNGGRLVKIRDFSVSNCAAPQTRKYGF